MSVILDALKKAQDHRRKSVTDIPVAMPAAPSKSRKQLYVILGSAVCILLALVLIPQLFGPRPRTVQQTMVRTETPPAAVSPVNPVQTPVSDTAPKPKPPLEVANEQVKPAETAAKPGSRQAKLAAGEKKATPAEKHVLKHAVMARIGRSEAQARENITPIDVAPPLALKDRPKVVVERADDRKILSLYNGAIKAAEQGNAGETKRLYLEILSERPGYLEALNNLGVTLLKEGRTKDAILYFQKCLDCRKDYAKAYNNMGLAMTQEGQNEQAAEYFRKAIELETTSIEPYLNLSALLRNEGRSDEALSLLQVLIDRKVRDATLFLSYGLLKDQTGDIRNATRYYRYYLSEGGNAPYRAKIIERLKVLEEYRPAGDR